MLISRLTRNCFRTKKLLPELATLITVLLSSDKTLMTPGHVAEYLLLINLGEGKHRPPHPFATSSLLSPHKGNLPLWLRNRKTPFATWMVLAYLPILKGKPKMRKREWFRIMNRQVLQFCFRHVLGHLKEAFKRRVVFWTRVRRASLNVYPAASARVPTPDNKHTLWLFIHIFKWLADYPGQ